MRYRVFRSGGYNNSGVSLAGGTVTAPISLSGNPTQPLQAVPKQYVDSKLLSLDASNFTTGMISVARLPGFTGDVTSTPGSTVLNLVNSGVVAGTYPKVTVNAKGLVTGGSSLSASDIPNLDWSKITSGKPTTVSGYGITDAITTSGGTITGTLNIQNTPVANNDIANKQYVDDIVNGNQYAVGDVILKPYTTTPPGFLKCNGSMVSKTTYSALYAVIGDAFGGVSGSSYTLMPGVGKPWKQQYNINNTQSGDITGWTTAGSLPMAFGASQAIVTKNRVYMLGGSGGNDYDVYTAPINSDGTLGTWSTAPSLPIPVSGQQSIVTKNRVYILGGRNGYGVISTVYSAPINADGTLGTWTAGPSLPGPLAYSQAIVTSNRVYLLGGWDGNGVVSIVYTAPINSDGTLGAWTTGPSLPIGLADTHAIVANSRLYLLGGDPSGGNSSTSVVHTAPINADGTLGSWTTAPSLPRPISQAQAIATNNKVYILGGNDNYTWLSTVYTAPINADGTLGTWTTGTPLPLAIDYSQVIVTSSRVYILGGRTSSGNISTIYSASFSGGLNDYSPYYDGTIQPTDPNSFGLPDFTAQDTASNIYHYIKY